VTRLASAVGGAARVEDLEAPILLQERDVRVPEDHGGRVGEAPPQAREPPGSRTGVVDHPDPHGARLDRALDGKALPQLDAVHVAVHREHGRPDSLDLLEGRDRGEVACVQDQFGGGQMLETDGGKAATSAREVGVGDDGEKHGADRSGDPD
jgi:hypothetical protein